MVISDGSEYTKLEESAEIVDSRTELEMESSVVDGRVFSDDEAVESSSNDV